MKVSPIYWILLVCVSCQSHKGHYVLFDPAEAEPAQVTSTNDDQILFSPEGVEVEFSDTRFSSEIQIRPLQGWWDASDYRFVRCEIENLGSGPQPVELGFGTYDLTLGGTIVPGGAARSLKAVIYRTEHPAYIESVFPVMHGKPDGTLRGWMDSACDSIEYIKLLFPGSEPVGSVRIGRIWLEDPYVLMPEEELRSTFYPFVDSFGQYMFDEWPLKIRTREELAMHEARERKALAEASPLQEWNRYGGWATGPQLEATGRFRVEKVNGKWWFVDPEGRLFWSHGIDCVEFGTQTRTRITDREHFFQALPEEGTSEGSLYRVSDDQGDPIRYLSFHALNLFRKYGSSWKETSQERIHKRLRFWGINTIGNWSDPDIYLQRRTPYVLTAYTLKTGLLADPFTPDFQETLEESLRLRKEEVGDPWCLGVFVDNELKWGVKWAAKIPEQILSAPASQPAKRAFLDRMMEHYGSVDHLNASWGTFFSDWEQLLQNDRAVPGAAGDMREFMKEYTSRYYKSCRDAVKSVDPEMLYLGCRMDFHLYPEDTSLNYIIRIASEYCDVVSFNRYRYTCTELVPPDGDDYPVIIGEFHFGSLETGLLQPGLRYAADPEERASLYDFYVTSALKNPYLVGTHWFQLADQAVTGRPDGENYQAGFLTVGDVPQSEITSAARDLGQRMYRLRMDEIVNMDGQK
ncbi:MAG: beta-galactosidase [Bacteroidales bacterium]